MSGRLEYSFGLWTCRLGTEFKRSVNPFTGVEMKAYSDKGLTSTEREATDSLLRSHGAKLAEEGEFYHLRFADGVKVCVGLGSLTDESRRIIGAGVNVLGPRLTDEAVGFLFELGSVANMAFLPVAAGDGPEAVTSEPSDDIKERWPTVVVVRTPDEFRDWVETYVGAQEVT